jgi:hypothetical protein
MRDLIEHRQQLVDRHDQALARYTVADAQFGAEVRRIVQGLAGVAESMEHAPGVSAMDKARSFMWLGDAQFDLAQGRHAPFDDAVASYERAEPYVALAHDALLRAKYCANLGNILLRGQGSDIPSLERVLQLYDEALPTLRNDLPAQAGVIGVERTRAASLLAQLRELSESLRSSARDLDNLRELARHVLPPAFARAFTDALASLAGRAHATTLDAMMSVLEGARSKFSDLMRLVDQAAPADPRLRSTQLRRLGLDLWRALMFDALRPELEPPSRDRLFACMDRVVRICHALADAGADADVTRQIELAELRPVALDAQRALARDRLGWVTPIWPLGLTDRHPSAVHLAGDAPSPRLRELCERLGFVVDAPAFGRELGEARFDALRRSALVIAELDARGSALAAVCYEVGIALTLGIPVLPIVGSASALPFDIDVEPLRWQDDGNDEWRLRDALDRLLALPQRRAHALDLPALVAAARKAFPAHTALVDELGRADDPTIADGVLQNIARRAGALVVHPTWPPARPIDRHRLFHVMPFREDWSNAVRDRARACWEGMGHLYRRHDDVDDPRIVRSLWDELCRATHILVDLTELNANVALELGIAHTLGTPTQVVGRSGVVDSLFPMVRKLRVVEYSDRGSELEEAIADLAAR